MKKIIILFGLLFCLNSYSQGEEFNTNDLKKVISIISFKPISNLKDLDQNQINQYLNMVEADSPMLKQLIIDSWYYCDFKKIDNFETYNYYYKDITRITFDKYCNEINALMLIDGTIAQPK
jgi:hypothetical protein